MHQRKWYNFNLFNMNTFRFLPFVICLLLVSPVHLYPRPDNQLETNKQSAQLETLNSKTTSVNVKNETEKPVFNGTDAINVESERIITDISNDESSTEQSRQLTVPFMVVPANWYATFKPSNVMVITQQQPLRIWAIGSVSKFPSFLESFVQRIQSYYSTYKYQDLSRPAPLAIINPTYHQHDTSGPSQTDPIDHDPIDEDNTDASTDDTSSGLTYYDDDENNYSETTESGEIIVYKK